MKKSYTKGRKKLIHKERSEAHEGMMSKEFGKEQGEFRNVDCSGHC